MRNITGQIVEGDDFFPREQDVQRYIATLATENVKLVFPRRSGKSSFVLHLAGRLKGEGWLVAEANVEDCPTELDFVRRLLERLAANGIETSWLNRLRNSLNSQVASVKVGSFLEVKTQSTVASAHATLRDEVETLFRTLDAGPRSILIALDEFPEVLQQIANPQPDGPQRLQNFLHWLRQLRLTYRQRVRWILYGSVGLDSFLERYGLAALVNDLKPLELTPLTVKEAHQFLTRLAEGQELQLKPRVCQDVLNRIGWRLPYFLQLMFDALRGLNATTLESRHVDQAFRLLLSPERLIHFDTWHQRLERQFGSDDLRAARLILLQLCQSPGGHSKQKLLEYLMDQRPNHDPLVVQHQLTSLLITLQREGYLMADDSQVAFRSFLLRDFWRSRFVL